MPGRNSTILDPLGKEIVASSWAMEYAIKRKIPFSAEVFKCGFESHKRAEDTKKKLFMDFAKQKGCLNSAELEAMYPAFRLVYEIREIL